MTQNAAGLGEDPEIKTIRAAAATSELDIAGDSACQKHLPPAHGD